MLKPFSYEDSLAQTCNCMYNSKLKPLKMTWWLSDLIRDRPKTYWVLNLQSLGFKTTPSNFVSYFRENKRLSNPPITSDLSDSTNSKPIQQNKNQSPATWSKLLPFRAFVSASPVHRTPSIMHIRHLTLFLGETNFHCGQNRWARRVKGLEGKRKGGKQPWWPELAIPCALFFHVQCGALLQHVFCICVHPQLCQCSCLHVKCSGPLWVDILSLHCVTQSCLCLLAQQIG